MIPWLLEQLSENPDACFPQRELEERFPHEFSRAQQAGLLQRSGGPPGPGDMGTYRHPSGQVYQVILTDDGYEAFDEDDFEVEPISVSAEELMLWSLDLSAVARKFRESNNLSGTPEAMEARLWYLGERTVGDAPTAYFLVLLDRHSDGMSLLTSLPARLPARYRRLQVICPRYRFPLEERQRLEGVGIWLLGLGPDDPWRIPEEKSGLQTAPESLTDEGDFQWSEDYTWVRWQGKEFDFTPRQAEVMSVLIQGWRAGVPVIAWPQIRARLGMHGLRMWDIFRRSAAWGTLIVPTGRRGAYRLNIPPAAR